MRVHSIHFVSLVITYDCELRTVTFGGKDTPCLIGAVESCIQMRHRVALIITLMSSKIL